MRKIYLSFCISLLSFQVFVKADNSNPSDNSKSSDSGYLSLQELSSPGGNNPSASEYLQILSLKKSYKDRIAGIITAPGAYDEGVDRTVQEIIKVLEEAYTSNDLNEIQEFDDALANAINNESTDYMLVWVKLLPAVKEFQKNFIKQKDDNPLIENEVDTVAEKLQETLQKKIDILRSTSKGLDQLYHAFSTKKPVYELLFKEFPNQKAMDLLKKNPQATDLSREQIQELLKAQQRILLQSIVESFDSDEKKEEALRQLFEITSDKALLRSALVDLYGKSLLLKSLDTGKMSFIQRWGQKLIQSDTLTEPFVKNKQEYKEFKQDISNQWINTFITGISAKVRPSTGYLTLLFKSLLESRIFVVNRNDISNQAIKTLVYAAKLVNNLPGVYSNTLVGNNFPSELENLRRLLVKSNFFDDYPQVWLLIGSHLLDSATSSVVTNKVVSAFNRSVPRSKFTRVHDTFKKWVSLVKNALSFTSNKKIYLEAQKKMNALTDTSSNQDKSKTLKEVGKLLTKIKFVHSPEERSLFNQVVNQLRQLDPAGTEIYSQVIQYLNHDMQKEFMAVLSNNRAQSVLATLSIDPGLQDNLPLDDFLSKLPSTTDKPIISAVKNPAGESHDPIAPVSPKLGASSDRSVFEHEQLEKQKKQEQLEEQAKQKRLDDANSRDPREPNREARK